MDDVFEIKICIRRLGVVGALKTIVLDCQWVSKVSRVVQAAKCAHLNLNSFMRKLDKLLAAVYAIPRKDVQ